MSGQNRTDKKYLTLRITTLLLIATILLASPKWSVAAECAYDATIEIKAGEPAPCDGMLISVKGFKKITADADAYFKLKDVNSKLQLRYDNLLDSYEWLQKQKTYEPPAWYAEPNFWAGFGSACAVSIITFGIIYGIRAAKTDDSPKISTKYYPKPLRLNMTPRVLNLRVNF